jgi:hypothetical protein
MKTTLKLLATFLVVLLIPVTATSVVHSYFELKADPVEIYPGETAVFTIKAELYGGFNRDIEL